MIYTNEQHISRTIDTLLPGKMLVQSSPEIPHLAHSVAGIIDSEQEGMCRARTLLRILLIFFFSINF